MSKHVITAALAGDPNTGKSTFFNAWTGLRQVTGNWPGVTVEKHLGQIALPNGEQMTLVDLPGMYSLHAVSEDERVASEFARSGEADVIINIVDAVNLERNLYLTLALMELGKPMVMVLSMTDILERQGFRVDMATLSERLGIPVVSANIQRRSQRQALERAVLEALATKQRQARVVYPESLNQAFIKARREGEPEVRAVHRLEGIVPGAETIIADVEKVLGTTPDVLIADARYDKIAELTRGIVKQVARARTEIGRTLDRFVLNRWLGIPIFLGVMYFLFWFTQVVGGCFIDFFDVLGDAFFVTGLGNLLTLCHAPDWLITLLADGLGTGIQTVLTFIPPVFFIFLGLSLLEDSGYMARAAYVVDRFMRFLGLPGSAFVPMLVGFGCTVPAIMATRTLSNRRDRLLTIFMAPFMSCGARLPVYALFGAAFFGLASGTMVFAIYLSGLLLAVFTGVLLKHTLFVGDPAPFVMELPLYHIPRVSTVFKQAWERLRHFVFRAGKVMALMVLLLSVCDKITVPNVYASKETTEKISIVEMAGRAMAPVFTPMGVDRENWQGSVALIIGLFAKEQVVSALNTLYAIEAPVEAEVAPVEASAEATETAVVESEEVEAEELLTWGSARTTFADGIVEAFATIPDAFAGLLDTVLDPLGVTIFKSEYEQAVGLMEKMSAAKVSDDCMAALQAELETVLDLEGLHAALAEATVTRDAIAQQVGQNPVLAPSLEAAEADLESVVNQLEQANALRTLARSLMEAGADRAAIAATFKAQVESYYRDTMSEELESDASLMETLKQKFNNDKNRAFAYLLFVLLYVPCLAAMATAVREIGWGYSTILFSYLTILGWCVATLYFQITTGHCLLWVIVPCVFLAAVAAVFYALGKKIKVKLVV
ncbi:MAG: ferrous iron transport protein B [Kiritimatiellae bacterium]|nr:ferrous iron transport protein B [Kiritimatiellia bacterium]